MRIFHYKDLNYHSVKAQFEKTVAHLQKGDFKSADVKKMHSGYYRAKLDDTNRLLFKIAKYANEKCLLLLEVILNHAYGKSKFLRGSVVDETKLLPLPSAEQASATDVLPLTFVSKSATHFHALDKFLFFDARQQQILSQPPPLVVIGSAGSGKTALTLEKLKTLTGKVLYITHSPFLVENATKLYYSFHYENEEQETDFLSFKEFIETIHIPEGKEATFRQFQEWFIRHRAHSKIKDAHQLFEEFRGVITGFEIDRPFLSLPDYNNLGARQSIFLRSEREAVYSLFEKYREFLKEKKLYDLNLVAYELLTSCEKQYDFVVVDEVQDFTNIQLYLILLSLKQPQNFILCGDSHQVVHPNFFSWAKIKSMFYKHGNSDRGIQVLQTNYRNSPQVTEIANRLLRIKNLRFGSLDRESTYLVDAVAEQPGEVICIKDSEQSKCELNKRTGRSTKYAVLVMRDEDKEDVRRIFNTPLLFSIHEAKGLEYENIILVNFVSKHEKEFREIAEGINPEDLKQEELRYSRADRDDKSLEVYKFFINSLYVAITRAVHNLYVVEQAQKHDLLNLLGLTAMQEKITIQAKESTAGEWEREAHKLEMQGKLEQAETIRTQILNRQKPDWDVFDEEALEKLKIDALNPEQFNKKAKDRLFEYALIYYDFIAIAQLIDLKYPVHKNIEESIASLLRRRYADYLADNVNQIAHKTLRFGVDYRDEFNFTPLMSAIFAGSVKIAKHLLDNGANANLCDSKNRSPLQIAFYKSRVSLRYAKEKIGGLYEMLLNESINIKINDRLVKVGNHKMEYLVLNYLIAVQMGILKTKPKQHYIQCSDILQTFKHYSENVLPSFRKQRPYINAILAKNEVNSNQPYNLKFLVRMHNGHYILNPAMEIRVEDEWRNVYELMAPHVKDKIEEFQPILSSVKIEAGSSADSFRHLH